MSSGANFNEQDFDPRRLRYLASQRCDDALSDGESEELEGLLGRSVDARSLYVEYVGIHSALEWEITSGSSIAGLVPGPRLARTPDVSGPLRKLRATKLPAIAAALLAVAAIALVARQRGDESTGPDQAASSAAAPNALAEVIATITRVGANAQWALTPHPDSAPRTLRENDVVGVTAGEIDVAFTSGAVVTLYAPAMMEAVSPMKGRAIRGRLAANVKDGAQGFTIETPRATVIDLGTVFGVEVGDEDATEVVVFKGAVDLHFDGIAGREADEGTLRLTSGEAMRIDKRGTPSRIVSIYSDRFSSQPNGATTEPPRSALISAVTDNIDREQGSWNYYEIVHGGMQEDAKAFVDRVAHEWNGLDAAGMPKFLLGGDYVKTFNNDKYSRDLELFVTVDQPCRLFILIDDRLAPPAWMKRDFQDTGYDVGLDVGPFHRVEDGVLVDDRMPGVGPGVLVDNAFSVWEKRVDKPQMVHLGSITADHRYINMYGVVAAPLDAAAR